MRIYALQFTYRMAQITGNNVINLLYFDIWYDICCFTNVVTESDC